MEIYNNRYSGYKGSPFQAVAEQSNSPFSDCDWSGSVCVGHMHDGVYKDVARYHSASDAESAIKEVMRHFPEEEFRIFSPNPIRFTHS